MTVFRYIKNVGKIKRLEKRVPHNLNESQKNRRFEICNLLLRRHAKEPFLNRIITCDEKWILHDNKEFSKANLHPGKVMMTVWWSMAGIIHYNFLQQGMSITSETYCDQLDMVNKKLTEKKWTLMDKKGPILLHDNARPHVARLTKEKLNQLKYEVLPHPPYSPDLSPTDYHFFPILDKFLKNKKALTRDAIMNVFEEFLRSRTPDFYFNGIENLINRWQKCLDSNGGYFY